MTCTQQPAALLPQNHVSGQWQWTLQPVFSILCRPRENRVLHDTQDIVFLRESPSHPVQVGMKVLTQLTQPHGAGRSVGEAEDVRRLGTPETTTSIHLMFTGCMITAHLIKYDPNSIGF